MFFQQSSSMLKIKKMFIEIQPGHVQFSAGKSIEPSFRDELRAELLRNQFVRAPSLTFNS